MMQGQRDLVSVTQQILSELAPLVTAQHGVFYLAEKEAETDHAGSDMRLKLLSSYAYKERKHLSNTFAVGEGLVGQCAFEKQRILLDNVPSNYIQISSGLGEAPPLNIIVLPVIFEGQVNAVIELASYNRFSEIHQTFLDQLTESIGIVLNTIGAGMRTEALLKQSQSLTQELQSGQNELRETNDRLERQAATLKESEERLREQQEELQQTNQELEEKARLLEIKNHEVELAKADVEEKAEQLTLTSRYKSEFLANMSHELRTPLNSLLILSKLLFENAENTLTGKQVEFARNIHSAGSDLLTLINDILDLSKIESGTTTVDTGPVVFAEIEREVEQTFRHVAENRGLAFAVERDGALPQAIETDANRLNQVLKNLLSNAFKFTERGSVTLSMRVAHGGWSPEVETLAAADVVVAFSVADTGIGIPDDKQRIIFEAFQQADGTTSRRYGGTGLGLSISRGIAQLLGGEIRVESEPGRGSAFTLYLPRVHVQAVAPRLEALATAGASRALTEASSQPMIVVPQAFDDDRDELRLGDRVLLVIEDDPDFARILRDAARARGFKVVVALEGDVGLALARKYKPAAITLDLRLPDTDGWTVLDRLKHDTATRHIPVHIISADDQPVQRTRGLKLGAVAYLQKPATDEALAKAFGDLGGYVDRRIKNLIVVEDDERERRSIVELVADHDVETTAVASGQEALALLGQRRFDCMVLDLGLPDMRGLELIEDIKKQPELRELPIIVYTGRELTRAQEAELRRLTESIIVKDVKSPERLLDETALFLHRVEEALPEAKRRVLRELHHKDPVLAGRRVLVIDDDLRNIFAITSALERQDMVVSYAENGRDGLAALEHADGVQGGERVDVVLTDIMMPEMDGYEVMRAIREQDRFRDLPIIALTAKAMKTDRQKCLEAGASDYIAKPVDVEQLLSLLRVWLYR
jgi:CheY-like chemotaxis protein